MNYPTLAGFIWFLQNIAGIPPSALPANSPQIPYAFQMALDTTNKLIRLNPSPVYSTAVYNLGTDTIINIAIDQSGQTYFEDLRRQMGINSFVAGVIQHTNDQGTG